jgi:hypothetical protein
MRLGRQIIDLVWLHVLNYTDEAGGIRHISVMEKKPYMLVMPVLIEMINTVCIKQACATFNAMYLVSFF